MIFSNPFLRSENEKIVLSKERAEAFINDNLPGSEIKPVAGDGVCILHSFVEGLQRIGNKVTLSEAKSSLRDELTSNHAYYKDLSPDDICLSDELQLFLDLPMEYYNINTVDLFLYTLSNVFQVDVLVIKSNTEDCWFEDLTGNSTENRKKLYFVKTLSQHIDPVVLKVNEENEDNSDDSITITHHLEGSEKCKVEIISSASDDELANAFPDNTDKEPKSEQTNEQRNENHNKTNSCSQCKYLLKLNLYMIY